jgi:hypothetical protein
MLQGVGSRPLNKTSSTLKPARKVVASFMLDGDNNFVPSVMPPPPPRLLKLSARVADVSAHSKQQAIDNSEGMAPPFARSSALAAPPRLLKWSAEVTDVSANSKQQTIGNSEGMAPPFARSTARGNSLDSSRVSFMEQARARERSVSSAGVAGEGFQRSAKVADMSDNSERQALDDLEGIAPPFARTAALGDSLELSFMEEARRRERSMSTADFAGEASDKMIQRTRSASVGAAPAGVAACGSCDTILEEEVIDSATESIDFDIDLARETP